MTLNGRYAAIAETMRLSEPTTKIWMKIDPYYQRQKCRPMTVLSGGIRFMRIFTEVPSGVWRRWGCRERQFPAFTLAISSETLELIAICSPSSAFQWSQNAWPWMTVTGYFALNSVFAPVWLAETVRLRKVIACKLMKTDTYCQRSNSSAGILLSGNISFMWIVAWVL